jgi:uncharacterized protein YggE
MCFNECALSPCAKAQRRRSWWFFEEEVVVKLRVTVTTCALVGVVLSPSLAAQESPVSAAPDIVVTSGEAIIKTAPDRAFVTLAVESRARLPKEAQVQNATTMTAVQQKLRGAGLPAEALRTVSIDLTPEFDYAGGRQQLRGYLARNTIEVRVDELAHLGDIIDAAVGTGATNVAGVRFDIKRREELERDALRQAVADARARAEALATGGGRSLGRIIRIDENGMSGPPPPRPMMAARGEMVAEAATPVAPGELEIRARVTLTVRLQ